MSRHEQVTKKKKSHAWSPWMDMNKTLRAIKAIRNCLQPSQLMKHSRSIKSENCNTFSLTLFLWRLRLQTKEKSTKKKRLITPQVVDICLKLM